MPWRNDERKSPENQNNSELERNLRRLEYTSPTLQDALFEVERNFHDLERSLELAYERARTTRTIIQLLKEQLHRTREEGEEEQTAS